MGGGGGESEDGRRGWGSEDGRRGGEVKMGGGGK